MNQPATPRLVPIDELNTLPLDEFAAALAPLFESAPPLARGLHAARPFASYTALLDGAARVIAELSEAEQIAVVNAHPRIGESAEAVRQRSALSYREQGFDREAALDQDAVARVYRELAELNEAYEQRFGFGFVVFVNGRSKAEIVDVLRERLHNPRAQELAPALDAMLAIARDRLRTLQPSQGEAPRLYGETR